MYEKLLLEFCKLTGVRILNGRCCEDNNIRKCTCINIQVSSVVDYVLCRNDFIKYISYFKVSDPNILKFLMHVNS